MDAVERAAGEKLRSFPALSRDVYQSFYSLIYNILALGDSRVRQVTFATTNVNMRPTLAKMRRKKAG